MFAVPDAFAAFYLTCFLVGLIFIVVSAVLGMGQHIAHLPGFSHGVHVGHVGTHGAGGGGLARGHPMVHTGHGQIAARASGGRGATRVGNVGEDGAEGKAGVTASPLNLMTIMAFLTWFGAAGYILDTFYGVFAPLALLIALLAGTMAGWLVYLFLVKVLLPGTFPGNVADQQIVGSLAKVSIAIPEHGLGEVVYTLGGSRHSDGAQGVNGLSIARDTEVVIVRYEKGIAHVQPWHAFVDGGAAGELWRDFLDVESSERNQ